MGRRDQALQEVEEALSLLERHTLPMSFLGGVAEAYLRDGRLRLLQRADDRVRACRSLGRALATYADLRREQRLHPVDVAREAEARGLSAGCPSPLPAPR